MVNTEEYFTTNHHKNITAAVNSTLSTPDVTIVSGENDMIQTNKSLLSLFSPTLAPLLSPPCCTSPALFFPDCSTISIYHVIDIINSGFTTISDNFTDCDKEKVLETGNLLNIDLKHLVTNIEPVSHEICMSPTKEQVTEKTQASRDKLLLHYTTITGAITTKNNLSRNNSKGVQRSNKTFKRKRKEEDSSCDTIFSCQECNYTAITSTGVNQHIKSKHEGICYTCDQCEYKTQSKSNLKVHVYS